MRHYTAWQGTFNTFIIVVASAIWYAIWAAFSRPLGMVNCVFTIHSPMVSPKTKITTQINNCMFNKLKKRSVEMLHFLCQSQNLEIAAKRMSWLYLRRKTILPPPQ